MMASLSTIAPSFTQEQFDMAVAHTLGFPRIGADRELKKTLESYWKGDVRPTRAEKRRSPIARPPLAFAERRRYRPAAGRRLLPGTTRY